MFKVSILFTYTRSNYVSLWLQGLNVHVHYLKLLIVYSLPFRWKYIHSGLNRTAAVFMTSTFPIRAHHHSINPSYITVTSVQISDCVACSSYSTINRSSSIIRLVLSTVRNLNLHTTSDNSKGLYLIIVISIHLIVLMLCYI